MSDSRKEAEGKMAKAIFISADCWLCVFDLLPPSQLGLEIAMISHRFDYYVDEHFKTRKWALKSMRIWRKIRKNRKKEMEIFNFDRNSLPIPQIELPRKIIGFERINITFIDRNVINFLHRFRQLFASRPINLTIGTNIADYRILELFLRNIWPMLGKNIRGIQLSHRIFRLLRQFVPSFLSDFPLLRVVYVYYRIDFFIEFPCDDSATASDGQSLAKWLFTPRSDNLPKVLNCSLDMNDENFASTIEAIKATFASASSPVNFIADILFASYFFNSVVLFDQINELTGEQLALKRTAFGNCFLLVRCPIARDESKWAKWEEEVVGYGLIDDWSKIDIQINDEDEIGEGLLDEIAGPSDQQK
ncbi:hypothetical protein niasHT_032969 [Heterodera trifolii]|uniref:F-box domain-containing protein n=1 Tax=Heterodera trifolii TaxID=157864 RepID=A0ABD2HPG1_9BILA